MTMKVDLIGGVRGYNDDNDNSSKRILVNGVQNQQHMTCIGTSLSLDLCPSSIYLSEVIGYVNGYHWIQSGISNILGYCGKSVRY